MPFSVGEFFDLFARYNLAIWPVQILAALAGLIVISLLFRPSRGADGVILSVLAGMWLLNGIAYHFLFFADLNPAAPIFALAFVVQAALLSAAVRAEQVIFDRRVSATQALAWALILYAILIYPALGFAFGHLWPQVPVFGVAPCPTTIFTVGVLLVGRWRVVRWLMPIPVLWSAVGGSAAVLLDVPQDYGLIVAGLVGLGYLALHMARHRRSA